MSAGFNTEPGRFNTEMQRLNTKSEDFNAQMQRLDTEMDWFSVGIGAGVVLLGKGERGFCACMLGVLVATCSFKPLSCPIKLHFKNPRFSCKIVPK